MAEQPSWRHSSPRGISWLCGGADPGRPIAPRRDPRVLVPPLSRTCLGLPHISEPTLPHLGEQGHPAHHTSNPYPQTDPSFMGPARHSQSTTTNPSIRTSSTQAPVNQASTPQSPSHSQCPLPLLTSPSSLPIYPPFQKLAEQLWPGQHHAENQGSLRTARQGLCSGGTYSRVSKRVSVRSCPSINRRP